MTVTENQDIILYTPRSNILAGVFVGATFLLIGIALPLIANWQLPALVFSLFFLMAGVWFGPIFVWKSVRKPALIIDTEGLASLDSLLHVKLKWEEIDAIYGINGAVFAVDISPDSLISFFARQGRNIPRRINISRPQRALAIKSINLPLSVDQLLAQIRERFAAQIEHNQIFLDDEREEDKGPE